MQGLQKLLMLKEDVCTVHNVCFLEEGVLRLFIENMFLGHLQGFTVLFSNSKWL